jgi:asparagine synthetase B (glutamine-hydrolysing)
MCGICITSDEYDFSMKHRGINTQIKYLKNLNLIHEHLPIQANAGISIIETERYIILFNGELFVDDYDNDLEYIKQLFSDRDLSDAIDKIMLQDGFYSFIIYDTDLDEIICFTDPLGKKQLYYSDSSIASELRPLVKGPVNSLHLSRTIKFGYVTDDSTPYINIKRVMPNRLYIFDNTFELLTVSPPLYEFKKVDTDKIDLYDLIDKAVKNRLKGHENVGLLLSGGLDSSIIYHHARGQIANTYCVNNLDDLQYAGYIDPNVNAIELKNYEVALDAMEMPLDLGSLYPQYSLFSEVDETVILTGDGADEAFGGYRRMQDYDAQLSDIFDELPFYHNVRIDRMSMIHTKECRSPFMSIPVIEYAMSLPYSERVNKKHLRDRYKGILPDYICNRPKEPLKTDTVRSQSDVQYRKQLVDKWLEGVK